jgi:hypothetical protein
MQAIGTNDLAFRLRGNTYLDRYDIGSLSRSCNNPKYRRPFCIEPHQPRSNLPVKPAIMDWSVTFPNSYS